jgi:hypothetical protein
MHIDMGEMRIDSIEMHIGMGEMRLDSVKMGSIH